MPKARHRPRGPGPGSAPHAPRRGPRAPGPARDPREAGRKERREGRGAPLGGGGGSAARAGKGGQPSRPPLVTPGSGYEDGGGGGKGGSAGKLPPRAHHRLELYERRRSLARAVLVRVPILRKQAGELQSWRKVLQQPALHFLLLYQLCTHHIQSSERTIKAKLCSKADGPPESYLSRFG